MPNKLQAYAEQAERTARQITGSHLAWTAFLTTAPKIFKANIFFCKDSVHFFLFASIKCKILL